MGMYATETSISLLLPGFLKGNTTTSDVEGTALFNKHIDRAESKINAYISFRYDISGFSSIPPLLTKLSEDVAVYSVIRATGFRSNDRNEYMDDFERAETTLNKLKKAEINLTFTDGSLVSVLSTKRFLSSTKDYTPIFGLDDETEWQRDEDEIDAQEDARE